ncbi:hypothetical protein ABFA07_023158 [Porites harrisoni]
MPENRDPLKPASSGVLISPRWVLTTASRFSAYLRRKLRLNNNNADGYFLQIGEHNLLQKEESELRIGAGNIYIHPNFTHATYDNDIALIKLRTEVKLGKFVRTVCLPQKQEGDLAIPRKYGLVTGWGATKALKIGQVLTYTDTYRYSNILQYSSFMIQEDQICQRSTSYRFNSSVTFCAGDGKGGKDTCNGDSGGPFVRESRREDGYRWIATGLVSWVEGCAQKDKFTFYTRVYPFIDWIKKTMDEG